MKFKRENKSETEPFVIYKHNFINTVLITTDDLGGRLSKNAFEIYYVTRR